MSKKKFDFTVDDIIAEFDKKKAEPSAEQDTIEDYDEEFSEELSPSVENGEYVPRHAKPAPPEEAAPEVTSDAERETVSDEAVPDTADNNAEQNSGIIKQDKTDKLDSAEEPIVEESISEEPDDNKPEDVITDSNNIDNISEEETPEPSEPEAIQPTAVLEGVSPTESFDESGSNGGETVSSVFANGIEDTVVSEPEAKSVETSAEDIPSWENILPEEAATIEETIDDAIADLDSEEIEEDEVDADEANDSAENDVEENDDEIIDDEPEKNADNVPEAEPTDDIPPFEPEPITLTADEAAEDAQKKGKTNILKELLPWKGDTVFEMVRKIVFIIAVVIFIGAGVMLASTLIQSNKAVKDLEEIKSVVTTTAKTTIDSDGNVVTIAPTAEEEQQHNIDIMSYYKGISDKVVGFIELEGCDIYQPVVQDPEDSTNTYYLTHTYYDEQNKGGAIFMDYRCTVSEDYVSPNIVLYGHNQEDGTMFGNLKNYKQNLEFYANNPTVTLRTEYESGTYLIYAYFVTNALENQDSNGEVFHYHDYIEALNDEPTFDWYMDEVQSRNQIISPVKAEFGDKLLVLSTCSNEFSNSRFVVFARKLRDGESVSDYDFTSASLNPYARGVDWTAIMSGETTLESEETTVPEDETSDEDGEETTKKKKKKKTTAASDEEDAESTDENTDETTDETTVQPDASDEDGEETTSKKKKTTTEATDETSGEDSSSEETTSKKKSKTTATETTTEETTSKKKSKTTTETTVEETTKKKKTTTADISDESEENTVTSVPESETEETTTVTANN